MADKRASEQNYLKYTINKQLKQEPLKSASAKPNITPAQEAKAANILQNLFSRLLGQKKQQQLAVLKENKIESTKASAQKLKQSSKKMEGKLKFREFQQHTIPKQNQKPTNKNLDLKPNATQGLQKEVTGNPQFQGKIEEDASQGSKVVNGVKQFQGEKIEKEQGLQEYQKVERKKETLPPLDGKALDPNLGGANKENITNSKQTQNNTSEEKLSLKRKAEDTPSESPKASVSVATDSEGNITFLNEFLSAQPTNKAVERGYSKGESLASLAGRAKKKARAIGEQKGKTSISL